MRKFGITQFPLGIGETLQIDGQIRTVYKCTKMHLAYYPSSGILNITIGAISIHSPSMRQRLFDSIGISNAKEMIQRFHTHFVLHHHPARCELYFLELSAESFNFT